MRIVADENIPYVAAAFGCFGDVHTVAGRRITRALLAGADVLLVRSVTRVGRELLDGAPVRFVGSATIGTDHVDTEYLAGRGVAFHSAPGSNAASVADYVTSALVNLQERLEFQLAGLTAALVGVGNVGSQVVKRLDALGVRALLNDPPLRDATGDARYRPLEDILPAADIVTLHVPLTTEGPYPTYHLADARFFDMLKDGAVFINTSRGKVVDEAALLAACRAGRLGAVVSDVFHDEPAVRLDVLDACTIATPHIAGYALDGKARGTQMLHDALAAFIGRQRSWHMDTAMPEPPLKVLELPPDASAVREAVLAVYDVMEDAGRLRRVRLVPAEARGAYFDRLRRDYPARREFRNTSIRFSGAPGKQLLDTLAGLTFHVEDG